jgi:hypothetical protein
LGLRGRSSEPFTAWRTSWSLRTLQEQTIMKAEEPVGDAKLSVFNMVTGCKKKKRLFK